MLYAFICFAATLIPWTNQSEAVGGRAAATICLRPPPLQVNNIFVFIRQVAPIPACWLLRHQQLS